MTSVRSHISNGLWRGMHGKVWWELGDWSVVMLKIADRVLWALQVSRSPGIAWVIPLFMGYQRIRVNIITFNRISTA